MQTIAQVGVILSAVGVVGSIGGYETGMYGVGGWILRTVIFFVAMVMCYKLETKMAKRKAHRKGKFLKAKNNKYEVICH
jgi:hypothetical protein